MRARLHTLILLLVALVVLGLGCAADPSAEIVGGGDFSLALGAETLALPSGAQGSTGLSVAWVGCGPRPVGLALEGAPAGLAYAFDQNPTPDLGTLTLQAAPDLTPGTYALRVRGLSGDIAHSAPLTVTVARPPAADFALALRPAALSLPQASSGLTRVAVSRLGGYSEALAYALEGAPAGLTGTFTPDPSAQPSSGEELLSLAVAPEAAPGTYALTIRARGSSLERRATLTLRITANADFGLSVTPGTLAASAGAASAGPATLSIIRAPGFTDPVDLALDGAPAGVTALFSPVQAPGTSSSLSLQLDHPAEGTYALTVRGSARGINRSAPLLLIVSADFSLQAPAAVHADFDGTGDLVVPVPLTVIGSPAFSSPVQFSVAGSLPPGVAGAFQPNPGTAASGSTLSLTVPSSLPDGSYGIAVQGAAAGLTRSRSFDLMVTHGDFALALLPSAALSLAAGTSLPATVQILPSGTFAAPVTLDLVNGPPGLTATFAPNPATATAQMQLSATAAVAPGPYTAQLRGSSTPAQPGRARALALAGRTHTLDLRITVTPAGDFSLQANPPSLSLQSPGTGTASGQVQISPVLTGGFSLPITYTVLSTLPTGLSVGLAPNPTTGTVVASVQVTPQAAVGSTRVSVQGSAGGLLRSVDFTVQVTAAQDFSLRADGASGLPGSGATSTVTLTGLNGFASGVSLALDAGSTGVTGTFSPNPAPPGTSTLNLAIPAALTPGTYTLQVTGTAGPLSHTAPLTLIVSPPPDFGLAASDTSGLAGGVAASTVTLSALNGFASPVTLGLNAGSTGITGTFSPNPAAPGTATLSLSIPSGLAPGAYSLQVTGASGPLSHSASFRLTVAAAPDFALGAADATGVAGSGATSTITLTGLNGFASPIALSLNAGSTGITGTFLPNPAAPGTATLSLVLPSGLAPKAYPIQVLGTSGPLSHAASFTLTVLAAPDFSLGASDAAGVAGGGATSTVTIAGLNGFASPVTLSLLPGSTGVTGVFSVNPSTPGAVQLSLALPSGLTPGTYALGVKGVSGALVHTVPLSLSVAAAPDFSFGLASSAVTETPGSSGSLGLIITPLSGFNGNVSLAVIAGLPSGMSASFNPNPATSAGGYACSLLLATGAVAPGTYALTIQGSSGALSHSTTLQVTVQDFSLSANPVPVALVQGGSAPTTLTITGLGGFSGAVSFSALGAPSGVTAAFSPNPATASCTLTLSATGGAATGPGNVVIQGQSGGLTHSLNVPVNVSAAPNFTVNLGAPTVTENPGDNGFLPVSAIPSGGFNAPITWSVASGLPAGMTASFVTNPSTLGGGYSTSLNLVTGGSVASGTYNLSIQGSGGTLTRTANLQVVVTGWSIAANLNAFSFVYGDTLSGSGTVNVSRLNGFSLPVTLSASNTSLTFGFGANPVAGASTSFSFTGGSLSPGVYSETLTGTANGVARTAPVSVTVQNFSVTSMPSMVAVTGPYSGSAAVHVGRFFGFSNSVNLLITQTGGPPNPFTFSFAPASTGGSSSILSWSATGALGTYTFTLEATDGTHSRTSTFTIVAPSAVADFYIKVLDAGSNPVSSFALSPGSSASGSVVVTGVNGYSGTPTLSLVGAPAGITASFVPNPFGVGSPSNLVLNVGAAVARGTYVVTVRATDGTSRDADLEIFVQ